MVHASHPYKAVGNTTVSGTLSFIINNIVRKKTTAS